MSTPQQSYRRQPRDALNTPSSNGNERRSRRNRGKSNKNKPVKQDSSPFKGDYEEMKGNVFQCYDETSKRNQFDKTVAQLGHYASTHFDNAKDIKRMLTTLSEVHFIEPKDPPFPTTMTKKRIWEKEVDHYTDRVKDYEENKYALFTIAFGQCSPAMKAQLRSSNHSKGVETGHDIVRLLQDIKAIATKFDRRTYFLDALVKAKIAFFCMKQDQKESNADYFSRFKKIIEVATHYGAELTSDQVLTKHELLLSKQITSIEDDISGLSFNRMQTEESGADRLRAYVYLKGLDPGRYGELIKDLKKSLITGQNLYPSTLADAYSMVNQFDINESTETKRQRPPKSNLSPWNETRNPKQTADKKNDVDDEKDEGVSLLQTNDEQRNAHKDHKPDTLSKEEVNLLQQELEDEESDDNSDVQFLLTQGHINSCKVNENWILLDSESTCHIFRNKKFLSNIRSCKPGEEIRIVSNGKGCLVASQVGDLPGVGRVFYHPESVANILSLGKLTNSHKITFNSSIENAFVVYGERHAIKFRKSPQGLYYYDASRPPPTNQATVLVQTVAGNRELFTRRQLKLVDAARKLYALVGRPNYQTYLDMIRENRLKNCPINVEDALRAIDIYGQDIAALRGKTVRQQPIHVQAPTISPVPPAILQHHKKIHLYADVCFINNLPFLVSISRVLKLRTVDQVPDVSDKTILPSLQKILQIYDSRGFIVEYIHADNGFKGMKDDFLPTRMNLTAAGEHVPEIERSIRTLKERTRTTCHGLPYRCHPTQLTVANVRYNNTWLNWEIAKDGASKTISPRTIIWGDSSDYNTHCRIELGSYCEVYEPRQITNTQAARTIKCIALYPTNNAQGGYKFLSLNSGKVVTRNQWVELPVSDEVIREVEALGKQQKQPNVNKHGYYFSWSKLRSFSDLDLSSAIIHLPDEGANTIEQVDAQQPSIDISTAVPELKGADSTRAIVPFNEPPPLNAATTITMTNTNDIEQGAETSEAESSDDDDNPKQNVNSPKRPSTANMPASRANIRYSLRQQEKKDKSFNRRYDRIHYQFLQYKRAFELSSMTEEARSNLMNEHLHFCLNQMSAKKAILKHGDVAIKAIIKEYKQLDDLDVFQPMLSKHLTKEQMAKALRSITVVKEKRCGRIKGRTVADGRAQRPYTTKAESSSPTVGTDSLLLSLLIDAMENRHVVTADIAGAFLKAPMNEFVLVKIDGVMVNFLVQANPTRYQKFVTVEYGRKVIYLRLKKALYGCCQSSKLWFDLFSKTLVDKLGFTLNPYDNCVANKMVDGSQLTVAWYVDDLKISHVDNDVVEATIKKIESHFDQMTVTRGKEHVYVGMHIKLGNKTVEVDNIEYIEECFELYEEDLGSPAATPAKSHLFEISENRKILDKRKHKIFHSCVAKLLYIAKRGDRIF